MNRPVYFFESKAPGSLRLAKELVQENLDKINVPKEKQTKKCWVVYCNDKRLERWDRSIRPGSKLVFVDKMAPAISLDLRFESKQIIVIDKPPGLPTQKTLKEFEDNLFDQVKLYFLQKKSFPIGFPYVGLHHRLDRGTSGLVLMTKQRSANKEISDLFKERKIHKEYSAYVGWGEGTLPEKWTQKDPIRRGKAKKHKFIFEVSEGGDPALTDFFIEQKVEGRWYKLNCVPKTGRTHQIRVHLKHKGYPILGDRVYGEKKTAPRLMLHAHKLRFEFKGESLEVVSNQPFDLDLNQ